MPPAAGNSLPGELAADPYWRGGEPVGDCVAYLDGEREAVCHPGRPDRGLDDHGTTPLASVRAIVATPSTAGSGRPLIRITLATYGSESRYWVV
jgi:hypothetical protein